MPQTNDPRRAASRRRPAAPARAAAPVPAPQYRPDDGAYPPPFGQPVYVALPEAGQGSRGPYRPRTHKHRTWLGRPWHNNAFLMPLYLWGIVFCLGVVLTRWHPISPGWLWVWGLISFVLAPFTGRMLAGGEEYTRYTRLYLGSEAFAAVLFLSAIGFRGLFHEWAIGTWALFTIVFTLTYPGMRHAQINLERRRNGAVYGRRPVVVAEPEPEPEPEVDPELLLWDEVFARAGFAGMETIEKVETASGFVLHVGLADRTSYSSFSSGMDNLTAAFSRLLNGLRPGAIRVELAVDGANKPIAHEVYVYVDIIDSLADILAAPENHTPVSIYDPIPIGKFHDASPICLTIAEVHTLIAGQTGKGKSNLMYLLIEWISRCVDAVLWFIDGKNGDTIRHILGPWAMGEPDETGDIAEFPLIDWAAVERTEAERIIDAAIELALGRAEIRTGGSKWRATPEDPAVVVVIDELPEMVGAHAGPGLSNPLDGATSSVLGSKMTRLLNLGRGNAVWLIISGQRATVTMIGPGDGKAQLVNRVSFAQKSAGDGADVFEGGQYHTEAAALTAQLANPGDVVMMGIGITQPRKARTFHAGEDDKLDRRRRRAIHAHSRIVPALDDASSALLAKFGYGDRFDFTYRAAWMRRQKPSRPLTRWDTPVASGGPMAPGAGTSSAARAGLADVVSPFPAVPTSAAEMPGPVPVDGELVGDEAVAWADIEARYAAEHPAGVVEPVAPTETAEMARGLDRFVQIIVAAGQRGITAPQVYQIMLGEGTAPADRTTVYPWRDKALRRNLIVTSPAGGGSQLLFGAQAFQERKAA